MIKKIKNSTNDKNDTKEDHKDNKDRSSAKSLEAPNTGLQPSGYGIIIAGFMVLSLLGFIIKNKLG